MRFLIYSVFLATATVLLAHGLIKEDDAARTLGTGGTTLAIGPSQASLQKVVEDFPYCASGIKARQMLLEQQAAKPAPTGNPGIGDVITNALPTVGDRVKAGISGIPPFVQPFSAAVVALAGLMIALFLPRTRFRGLALLGEIATGAIAVQGLLTIEQQADLVRQFSLLKPLFVNFPYCVIGSLFLSGITLGVKSRTSARAD